MLIIIIVIFQVPKRRSIIQNFKDSLQIWTPLEANEVHFSIQSNTRFQLIIDPSNDQSIMRLLFTFGLLDKKTTKMIVCSDLPGDIQGAVSIEYYS